MGCAESKSLEQETAPTSCITDAESPTVQKTEPEPIEPVKKPIESQVQILPKTNNTCEDSNLESSKKEKRIQRPNNATKKPVQRMKPRELSQVQPAWGKKTTVNEDTFLEDLRLLQEVSGQSSNYERNYHVEQGVDRRARHISGDENLLESSNSDILENHQKIATSTEDESFDASKIIDVEKFRAANVGEKKENSNQVDSSTYDNTKSNLTITESNEIHKLNSSFQEITQENDDSLKVLYNDDDNDLIKSIEQEFAQDYYLPGQIIN